jgi:imidazoleglycerol-phosphate dehydratase
MDETLTEVALDASNRPYLIWKVVFSKPKLGTMDTELFKEWFRPSPNWAGSPCMWEITTATTTTTSSRAASRAWRALRTAVEIDPRQAASVPSTKGVL